MKVETIYLFVNHIYIIIIVNILIKVENIIYDYLNV